MQLLPVKCKYFNSLRCKKCLMRKNGGVKSVGATLSNNLLTSFPPNKLRFRVSSIYAVLFRLDPGLKLCD